MRDSSSVSSFHFQFQRGDEDERKPEKLINEEFIQFSYLGLIVELRDEMEGK